MEALTTEQRAILDSDEEAGIAGTVPTVIFIDTPDRAPWEKNYIYSGSSLAELAGALRDLASQYDALHAEGWEMYGPNEKYGTINLQPRGAAEAHRRSQDENRTDQERYVLPGEAFDGNVAGNRRACSERAAALRLGVRLSDVDKSMSYAEFERAGADITAVGYVEMYRAWEQMQARR